MLTRDDIKEVVEDILDHRQRMESGTHVEHHAWIKAQIENQEARTEFCLSCAKAVAQWSVIGLLGGVIYWLKTGHWQ